MNGRVYDPTIGRFMSADPFIQAPTDTQSYNRYSYVRNNPVNLVDPSGYNWLSKQWKKWGKPILAIAAAAIITFYTVGAGGASLGAAWSSFFGSVAAGTTTATSMMAAGALAGGAAGAIMTGTVKGTLTGALWGAASAGIANHIGHAKSFASISKSLGGYGKHLAHGLSRGLISKLQGGTFRAGFYSGFAASAFSPGTTMGGDGPEGFTLRTTMAGVIGGTASELGGGKFANGAVSGAFVHMFNAEGGRILKRFTKYFKSTKIDDILETSALAGKGSGKTVVYDRIDGGYQKALQHFYDLNLDHVKEITDSYGGFKGKLDDGSGVSVRPSSKYDKMPTVQFTNSSKSIKIRYRGVDDEPMHSGIGLFQ